VNFYDGTSATIYNDIIVGFHRNVDFQMRHFLGQNGHLQVWVDEYSEEVNSVKWYFDGMLVSTEEKLDTIVNAFGHKIEAEIVFENGAKRKRTIWVDGGLNGKFIDDFASFESNSANVQWDFKPKVTFKKDGKTYTSLTANNQSADFEVMDIAYYSTSSQGKPIYKIQASIDCFVRELASTEVFPLSATLTFAVEFN
jgi:hypothetical protein